MKRHYFLRIHKVVLTATFGVVGYEPAKELKERRTYQHIWVLDNTDTSAFFRLVLDIMNIEYTVLGVNALNTTIGLELLDHDLVLPEGQVILPNFQVNSSTIGATCTVVALGYSEYPELE